MNIAYVFSAVYPFVSGGVQKRFYEIGTRLAADDHQVTIYGRKFWDGPATIEQDGLTLRGVAPAANLYTEDGRRSIQEALGFALRLIPSLRDDLNHHDVVVVSPFFPALATTVATVATNTPVVTTWHEVWLDYWEEYLGSLAFGGKVVERLAARVSSHSIAVSELTANRLSRIGPSRADIDVVHNGIDVDRVTSTSLPEVADGQQGYDVLFVGRLIKDKRVSVLLDAFDRLATTFDIRMGIIGEGPHETQLRQHAERLDTVDRIEFLGHLPNHEAVLGQMRAADIFASPSTREGFGITYVEAMAADCTVIAADHPESAARDVIADAGYLVSPTVDGVTEALKSSLNGNQPDTDPQTRAKEFDWDTVADQAADVYRRAIRSQT